MLVLKVVRLRVCLHDVDAGGLEPPRLPLAEVCTASFTVEQATHAHERFVLLAGKVLITSEGIDVAEPILLDTLGYHLLNRENKGFLFAYKGSPLAEHVATVALVVVVIVFLD